MKGLIIKWFSLAILISISASCCRSFLRPRLPAVFSVVQFTVKHANIDAMQILGKFFRIFNVIQQFNVCAYRQIFYCFIVGQIVNKPLTGLCHIVMLELLALRGAVFDVARTYSYILKHIAFCTFTSLILQSKLNCSNWS